MPNKRKYVLVAERALGRPLPVGAIVHHIDEDRRNNRNDNLCILQDGGEHRRLHRRLRILKAGGNSQTQQICCTCQQVKDAIAFPPSRRESSGECHVCLARRRTPNPESFAARCERNRRAALSRWKKVREVSYAHV